MTNPDLCDQPYHSIEFENGLSVEDIFEDLFIARIMLPGEFGKFMLIRRLFRRECQALLDQIMARAEADLPPTAAENRPPSA